MLSRCTVCNSFNMVTRALADLSPEGDKSGKQPSAKAPHKLLFTTFSTHHPRINLCTVSSLKTRVGEDQCILSVWPKHRQCFQPVLVGPEELFTVHVTAS